MINHGWIVKALKEILKCKSLSSSKEKLQDIKKTISFEKYIADSKLITDYFGNSESAKEYLIEEIDQILKTKTKERANYYIQRLLKSLSETDTNSINDLNMNLWKQYDDILTDSLWLFDKRDASGAHNAAYWGNFIPQIPNQLIRRYTKKNDWVLDTFLGSGTTLMECKRLGRNGVGIELQPKIIKLAKTNLAKDKSLFDINVRSEIFCADSTKFNFINELKKIGIDAVQLIIMHPPYWDIIKFSENKYDLSNSKKLEDFLYNIGKIIDNTYEVLDKGRYLALIIGDKYSGGEWIPVGFYCMQEVLKRKYKLKSTIVKNFEETKGKMNQKELWRYRALKGGFYIFKHEYIFLFEKE